MKWNFIKIGEVASIIDGDRGKNYPKQNEFLNIGYCLFLNTGNVTKDGFSFKEKENQFITKEKDGVMRKGKLERGDIIFTSRGTIGNVAYYDHSVPYDNVRINSGMVILRASDDCVEQRYLYQLLKSNYQRARMFSYITGSAQPQLPIKNFSQIEIPLPRLPVQRRIADILSAYDDLIENNQKQIKLLEEAAVRLYKEWFVYLRFPGYENTPIVDGVPEGWEPGRFKDLCSLVKETVKVKDLKIDMPYIGLEHMPRKSICLNEWSDASTVNSNKFRFKENDILFGKIRPYFHKVGFAITNGVASTDTMVFRAKDDMFGLALMTAFSDLFIKHTSTACKEGAKMPRADWNEMKNYEVLIPAQSVLKEYDRQIQSLCSNIKVLCQQVKLLKQARDKLLPKLMRGEIEV